MFLFLWTSLFFWYSFNKGYYTSEFEFIQKISSFFSLRVLCAALFWNLGFFCIPNYVFIFNKQKATAHVSSPFNCMATFYASSPSDEWTATNLVSIVWKFITCWFFFGRLFLSTNHGQRPASPPTHTWQIESESLPCPHHLLMIERVGGETVFLSIILLTTIVC